MKIFKMVALNVTNHIEGKEHFCSEIVSYGICCVDSVLSSTGWYDVDSYCLSFQMMVSLVVHNFIINIYDKQLSPLGYAANGTDFM